MSTNNNRLGKEIQPQWLDDSLPAISKISGAKLQRLIKNNMNDITAISLKERGVQKIEDFSGFDSLRRLDLSHNMIKRLGGMSDIPHLSMLNVSSNNLDGGASCEELRYLTEIRTLNIGSNPKLRHIESHIVKPLSKLQALVANECGFSRVSFLKFCPLLNTLILSKNSLSVFPTSPDISLSHLTKLSLGGNDLSALPDLTICPNLVELRINNNRLTVIPDSIKVAKKLKILDVSYNQIDSWSSVDVLTSLQYLTNLSLKGNPLPSPPSTYDNTQLREDTSADRVSSEEEKRYRHHVLSMFQTYVGTQEKPKVRLIVLDMKRVKMKWSHHFPVKNVEVPAETVGKVRSMKRKSVSGSIDDEAVAPNVSNHESVNSERASANSEMQGDNEVRPKKKKKLKSKHIPTDSRDGLQSGSASHTAPVSLSTNQSDNDLSAPSNTAEGKSTIASVPPTATAASGVIGVKIVQKKSKKKNKKVEDKERGGMMSANKDLLSVLSGPPDLGESKEQGIGLGGGCQWD